MTPREQYLRRMNKDDDNEADDKDEYYYDGDKCDEEPTGLNSFVLRFSSPSSSSNVKTTCVPSSDCRFWKMSITFQIILTDTHLRQSRYVGHPVNNVSRSTATHDNPKK